MIDSRTTHKVSVIDYLWKRKYVYVKDEETGELYLTNVDFMEAGDDGDRKLLNMLKSDYR